MTQETKRKIIISILFGLLGFICSLFPIEYEFPPHKVGIVLGLIFPMLIAQAWGWRYGLVAATVGLGAMFPFVLWRDNGWPLLLVVTCHVLWFVWHGYWADQRQTEKPIWTQAMIIEIPYRAAYVLLFLTIGPMLMRIPSAPWSPEPVTPMPQPVLYAITIKEILNAYAVLLIVEILRLFKVVRRFFGISVRPENEVVSRIMTVGAALAIGIWLIDAIVDTIYFSRGNARFADSLFAVNSSHDLYMRTLFLVAVFSGSWLIASFVKRVFHAESSMLSVQRQAKREIDEREQQYRTLVDHLPQCIFLKDVNSRYLSSNRAYAELLGVSPHQIVGRTDYDFFPRELAKKHQKDDEGLTEVTEYVEEFNSGTVSRWVRTAKVPLTNEHGEKTGVLGIFWDVTDESNAQQQQTLNAKRMKALLRLHDMNEHPIEDIMDFALETGVELTGSKIGYIYLYDEEKEELSLFSWSRQAMKECEVTNRKTVYKLPETGIWGDAIRTRQPFILNDYAAPHPHKKGTPKGHVELRNHMNAPIFEGNRIVALIGVSNKDGDYNESDVQQLVLMMDAVWSIKRQREAEQQLRTLNEKLEQRVMERTAELEEANRAKSEFLANMSHEIRTPLNAVLGFSELLSGMVGDETHRNYLHAIGTAGRSLLTLINDILDLSKIEAGMLEIKPGPVSIRHQFGEIQQIFAPKVLDKGLKLHVIVDDNVPKTLLLDEIRLRQVLLNLVGNAVKFTEQGYIQMHADFVQDGDTGQLNVIIEDTGIGIHPDDRELIFESFRQQSQHNTRKYGGTGLGLTITRKLVEGMGGAITVTSELGKGSTFAITLHNVAIAEEPPNLNQQSRFDYRSVTFHSQTVLVVDDVESSLNLIVSLLEPLQLKVIPTRSGKEALEIAARNAPDIVITDIPTPAMGGRELLAELRESEATQAIPLIALSASVAKTATDAENQDAPYDYFLSKPVQLHELVSILCSHLEHEMAESEPSSEAAIPDVIHTIPPCARDTLTPLVDQLKSGIRFTVARELAERLKQLGQDQSNDELRQIGSSLELHTSTYDIGKINGILNTLNSSLELTDEHARE